MLRVEISGVFVEDTNTFFVDSTLDSSDAVFTEYEGGLSGLRDVFVLKSSSIWLYSGSVGEVSSLAVGVTSFTGSSVSTNFVWMGAG